MNSCKPLYPMPWWAESVPAPSPCDEIFPRDEFIVRYVGTDCEGNALYCVRRRRCPCDPPRPPVIPPRCCTR